MEPKKKRELTLADPLGLRTYGESLLTRRVKTWMAIMTILILAQFVLDSWAWPTTWGYALGPTRWAIVLGEIFAVVMLLLDVNVITMYIVPTIRATIRTLGWRLGLLGITVVLTAFAVELRAFASEINRWYDNVEKVAADLIRENAIDAESARYKVRIDAAAAKGGTSVADIVTERSKTRVAIEKAAEEKRRPVADRIAASQAAEQKEAKKPVYGFGVWRPSTGASASTVIRNQRKEDLATLKDLDEAAEGILTRFDAETAKLRAEADTRGDGGISKIQDELSGRIAAIRAMSLDELGAAYPGNWRVSRGLMNTWDALQAVVASKPSNIFIVWGCRLLMSIIPLVMLTFKFGAPQDVKDYYDPNKQEAARLARLKADLQQTQTAIRVGIEDFNRQFAEECLPNRTTGLSKAHGDIRVASMRLWERLVLPHTSRLISLEQEMNAAGRQPPAWPYGVPQPGSEDRTYAWYVEKARLVDIYGWVDPSTEMERLKPQMEQALTDLDLLASHLAEMERDRLQTAEADLRALEGQRREYYIGNIMPIIRRIESVERQYIARGLPFQGWPTGCETAEARRTVWQLPKGHANNLRRVV